MTLQEEGGRRGGRRVTKFTPANLQKIKHFVAQGLSREEIAKAIDVTIGSLQVTCSRLGISLRRHDRAARVRVSSRAFVSNGQLYVGHMRQEPDSRARFQIVLQSKATDLAITACDIGRLGLEASTQGLAMTELMGQVLAEALKKDLIQEILGEDVPRSQP